MKTRVSGVPYPVELEKIGNSEKIPTFFVGLVFGVLAVLAVQRLIPDEPVVPQLQRTPASQIVESYKMGVEDALRTNPPSWRLEETCLEIWANRQPTQ